MGGLFSGGVSAAPQARNATDANLNQSQAMYDNGSGAVNSATGVKSHNNSSTSHFHSRKVLSYNAHEPALRKGQASWQNEGRHHSSHHRHSRQPWHCVVLKEHEGADHRHYLNNLPKAAVEKRYVDSNSRLSGYLHNIVQQEFNCTSKQKATLLGIIKGIEASSANQQKRMDAQGNEKPCKSEGREILAYGHGQKLDFITES